MKVCPSAASKSPFQHNTSMVSRQVRAAARLNKHGAPGLLCCHSGSCQQIGELACHISGFRRATKGAVTCFTTRRAPSSPHLACGLNGSFFLHTCGPLNTAPAGGALGIVGWSKTCGTLRGWDVLRNAYKHARTAEISRCLGKKVSFFLKGCFGLGRPAFVGLET
jgi:hypothetical protein